MVASVCGSVCVSLIWLRIRLSFRYFRSSISSCSIRISSSLNCAFLSKIAISENMYRYDYQSRGLYMCVYIHTQSVQKKADTHTLVHQADTANCTAFNVDCLFRLNDMVFLLTSRISTRIKILVIRVFFFVVVAFVSTLFSSMSSTNRPQTKQYQ